MHVDQRNLTVLMDPAPEIAPETVKMLAASLPADVTVAPFGFRQAFIGHYDVLHVHWPELLLSATTRMQRIARPLMFAGLVLTNRARRRPMVWTVHNAAPHERQPPLARFALSVWGRAVHARVFMYESARFSDTRGTDTVIRRGDYSPYLERLGVACDDQAPRDGMLSFGLIRPYKGIENLITAYAGLPAEGRPALSICGSPDVPGYAEEVELLSQGIDGLTLELRHVPDLELVEKICAARLIVLPYKKIYNSGTVLLALTLRRPVLVPDSPTMRELRDEVGGGWVSLFSELTPAALQSAYESVSGGDPESAPDLSRREWGAVGSAYAELYARLTR